MRARRVDANHAEIRSALRAIGATVTDTSGVGDGFPDLVVSYRGQWHMVEVKDGAKAPSARALTYHQTQWAGKQKAPVILVNSVEEAVNAITKNAA